ncbi:Regulatory protein RecX [gamma proteobacterium HdN1]|nr:Regulatory protein RecX [gamma proteobacterium HdN1]
METESDSSNKARIRQCALASLGQREHTRKTLRQKLLKQIEAPADVDAVIEDMVALGYLNEKRFTESLIRKRAHQGYGPRWIQQDLQQAGIGANDASIALDESELDWNELARALCQKKYRSRAVVDAKERAKRQRFLYSKGFTGEQIKAAETQSES